MTVEEPGEGLPYTWVHSSDFRVAETRLLTPVASIGRPDSENLLIRGDALHALTALAGIGQIEALSGQVKLCYLDPPFNTGKTFEHYEDNLEKSIYLTMMRDRLIQVARLLRPDGSIWLHCDDSMAPHLRILLDEVFGERSFVATVVWQKRYSRDNRPAIGPVHDYIHVYAPMGTDWKSIRNRVAPSDKTRRAYRNPNNDPRGDWRPIPIDVQAGHATEGQFYPITTPAGVTHLPPKGRAWTVTRDRFDQLQAAGRIYFGKDDRGKPNLVRYFDEVAGLTPWTWWPHEEVGHNDEAKKEILDLFPDLDPFDTPKPERLMARIIEIATDPGDIVLDPFAGSGTTAAVATKLERRWVAAEASRETIERFAFPRLSRVISGDDPGGITADVGWDGGSGFRVLDVGPSMFDVEDERVVLADWATGGALAEATAAQVGIAFEPSGPFAGRKGRARLAVVDGLVNTDVVDLLVDYLGSGETLLLYGTGLDPAVTAHLVEKRPGSVARFIPQAILEGYGRPRRWTPVHAVQVVAS